MGLGFALFFHVILFVILLGVLSPVFLLFRKRLNVERPSSKRLLLLAYFGLAGAPFALFIATIVWRNIAPPSFLYWNVFNQWADSTVQNLRGTSDGSNDGAEVFLAFSASDGTLSNILSTDFIAVPDPTRVDLLPLGSSDRVPVWWIAPRCASRTTHVARNVRQWDTIVVTNCAVDSRIYVQARWID